MKLVEPISPLKTKSFRNFEETKNEPYIVKSIISPTSPSSLGLQVQRRLDDVQRLTKYFFDRGSEFLAGEALLNASKTEGRLIDRVVGALGSTLQTTGRILGQAAVAGTGTRLTPPDSSTYLGQNQAFQVLGTPIRDLLGEPVPIRIASVESQLERDTLRYESSDSFTRKPRRSYRRNTRYGKAGTEKDQYIRLRVGEGQPSTTPLGKDSLNALEIQTARLDTPYEIIPFEIAIYDPKNNNRADYIYLRAYLQNLSDDYTGEWNGVKYIGRAENLYNYTGFNRSIGFGIKVAALSRAELQPLYRKLNRLAGSTSPSYSNSFLRGIFVKVTIGDYLKQTPGFFTAVNIAWNVAYPWEIGVNDNDITDTETRVPHILDVSFGFTPVHDFTPEYGETYFARPNEFNYTTATAEPISGLGLEPFRAQGPAVPREHSHIGERDEQLARRERQESFERSIERQEV